MVDLERYFERVPYGTKKWFSKSKHPDILAGFKHTVWAEPRLGFPPQLRHDKFHAVDYGELCEIHWDKWNPETHPWEHLRDDAPHWLAAIVIGGIAGGGLAINWLIKSIKAKQEREKRKSKPTSSK
ncbi:MAG: hypothetical protein P1Q69_10935 [Candidatus Thorarchaeota archaeon]|nr:hypothetical protein [Candidatus Thorarchaeota archaeon]